MGFMLRQEVIMELKEKILSSGSLRTQANKMGICPSHLSRIISRSVRPGPKVLNYLGLREVRVYVDNTDK